MLSSSAQSHRRPSPLRAFLRRNREQVLKLVTPAENTHAIVQQKSIQANTPRSKPFSIGSVEVSRGSVIWIAGPQFVDSVDQILSIASCLADAGIPFLRARAYWPDARESDFQRHLISGLKVLKAAAKHFDLAVVSEIVSVRDIEIMCKYCDIIEVSGENASDEELLRALGRTGHPVLLNRHSLMPVDCFLRSVRILEESGTTKIILAENIGAASGPHVESVLALSSIISLRRQSSYPVFVSCTLVSGDLSFTEDLSAAAIAAGADGIISEFAAEVQNIQEPASLARSLHTMIQRAKAIKHTLNALMHYKFDERK